MVLIKPLSSDQSVLVFFVNGKKVIANHPDPQETLLLFLRNKLRLCGTKLGCGEGGCGACTVMISKYDRNTNKVNHFSANACLMPISSVHGLAVTTVEGIGSTKQKLHPVQERIAKAHGSQCGFCTPGFVMSMYSLLRSLPTPSMADLEIAFQGNLCRCTGYRPILEGYRSFTSDYQMQCAMGDKCCRNLKNGLESEQKVSNELFEANQFAPYDSTQEPIFPPELKLSDELDKQFLVFRNENVTWYRPTTLVDLLKLKQQYPDAKLITGNTEVGVEVKFKSMIYPHLIATSSIPELNEIKFLEDGIQVGGSVTLDEIENILNNEIKTISEEKTKIYSAIVKMLHYFAGKQIRNVASIGGNIATASPISDLNPILMAADVELEISNLRKTRKIKMDESFFVGYRKSKIESDEVIVSLKIPHTNRNEFFVAYKQAKRRDDDIAIVNMSLYVEFKNKTDVVENIRVAYGGMAPTTVLAINSANSIKGMKWSEKLLDDFINEVLIELPLSNDAPGGVVEYRKSLTISLFYKGYLAISQILEKNINHRPPTSHENQSGSSTFHNLEKKSVQLFEINSNEDLPEERKVGFPEVHISALKQATGEALYCDDIPRYENELYLAFVFSTRTYADILSIDESKALKLSGVHGFFCAKDLSIDQNKTGVVHRDEEVFASKTVFCQGQVIGAVVADTQEIAQRAAKMVHVEYKDKFPVIITIEEAIEHNSFLPKNEKSSFSFGDVDNEFKNSDYVFEDEFRMGGQEHFYLEPQAAIAIPKDPDELEVYCTTQNHCGVQSDIHSSLGIPKSKISVRVKRIGGAFGGKESRNNTLTTPTALAAYRLGRPVRCLLDRNEDILVKGGRHPFYFKYKFGFMKDGKLTGLDLKMYSNAGFSADISYLVIEKAIYAIDNTYAYKAIRVDGNCCRTNLPSNTAFRGFGIPQALMVGEHIIRKIARILEKDPVEIMDINLLRKKDASLSFQLIGDSNLERCWNELLVSSNYGQRKQQIIEYNKQNRWKKRGISVVPTKYGVAFAEVFMNQAAAIVNIYTDGSVNINHGGVEMGQGLHTKMVQVASRCLGIPIQKIHNSESATDKVPNTLPTAGSVSADMNGFAVMNACKELLTRLQPIKDKYPDKDWDFWIVKAFLERISLSATGYHATQGLDFDRETKTGRYFDYFCYGVACTEVEIDCLTGDHQLIRTDIVMDVGSSLNPAIDVGQIEGGFIQGYGLYTLEEMIYSPTGKIYSLGPGMYKIPGFSDIPAEFNVSLLTDAPNPRAVYSSKAIGEPPLFLASSAFFAIKEAIEAARSDEGLDGEFCLMSPATSARIRLACSDKFTRKLLKSENRVPWNVMV